MVSTVKSHAYQEDTIMTQEPETTSRRVVLLGVGLVGVAGALTACGGSSSSASAPASSGPAAAPPNTPAPSQPAAPAAASLGTTSEIPVGGGKIFAKEKVVVTQPKKGEFEAFSAICTHMGCTVGSVSGGTINCPCHGSKYAITDAHVVGGPAPRPLPRKTVKVSGGEITVT
jgi:Rieske Fe-S protein